MKLATMGLAALFLSAGLSGMAAPKEKTKMSAKMAATKKLTVEVKYKAKCGMVYTAAEARKNNYICPMDKKPLTKMTVAKSKVKPGKMKQHKM